MYLMIRDAVVADYEIMRDALNATGRPILFSMCNWGTGQPHKWGAQARPSPAMPPADRHPGYCKGQYNSSIIWVKSHGIS